MKQRTLDEMITYFNQQVSEMDIDRKYKIALLGMITAIGFEAQKQKWIPCSERLPEEKINPNTQDYDWVLCSTSFGDVRAYHFGRGKFLHGCGDVTQYVIAWQPMPEPYKDGGNA